MKTNNIRIYFTGALLLFSSFAFSQNKESLKIARNFIINEQVAQAITHYKQLIDKEPDNAALLTEYAYILALNGLYEGALMNLDRAKLSGNLSGESCFYIVQVFSLIAYDWVVTEYVKKQTIPEWIQFYYEKLLYKYKLINTLPNEDLEIAFKRANYLAANSMCFQSIALYESILENYPDESILHIGYSIPLEKANLRKLAAEELETGISLMSDDPKYAEAKIAFNQRLAQLKQSENAPQKEQPEFLKKLNKFNPQTMLYAGGMFSENYTSFSSRFGIYLSNSFNGSLNLGVSGNSSATSFNIGLSGYEWLGNVFMVGFGVSDQIGKDSNVFSIMSSFGFSFINSKRNSSWDIFFSYYWPLQKDAVSTYGISIGKSFYFGTR